MCSTVSPMLSGLEARSLATQPSLEPGTHWSVVRDANHSASPPLGNDMPFSKRRYIQTAIKKRKTNCFLYKPFKAYIKHFRVPTDPNIFNFLVWFRFTANRCIYSKLTVHANFTTHIIQESVYLTLDSHCSQSNWR